jgi:multidrug efflux pump
VCAEHGHEGRCTRNVNEWFERLPVLMTTAATVMGHFPLVLVTGAGAEARNAIGIILVAGMAIGTVFTLFLVPSVLWLAPETESSVSASAGAL